MSSDTSFKLAALMENNVLSEPIPAESAEIVTPIFIPSQQVSRVKVRINLEVPPKNTSESNDGYHERLRAFLNDKIAWTQGFVLFDEINHYRINLPSWSRTKPAINPIVTQREKPLAIRCDNGPELTSRHFLAWCIERQIELVHIQPGKPQQNGHVEGFHARLRDECLNVSWFENLWDARRKIAAWRKEYNEERLHSSLGYQTPTEYARQLAASADSVPPGGTPPPEAAPQRADSPNANFV